MVVKEQREMRQNDETKRSTMVLEDLVQLNLNRAEFVGGFGQ